jgi:hypothetical protein
VPQQQKTHLCFPDSVALLTSLLLRFCALVHAFSKHSLLVRSAQHCVFTMAAATSHQPFLSITPRFDECYSDSSVSSDNDDSQLDLNTDLVRVQRALKDLNIINAYRPRWTCKEAFREAYQNWQVLRGRAMKALSNKR